MVMQCCTVAVVVDASSASVWCTKLRCWLNCCAIVFLILPPSRPGRISAAISGMSDQCNRRDSHFVHCIRTCEVSFPKLLGLHPHAAKAVSAHAALAL